MKKAPLRLIVLISMSLAVVPAYAGVLEEMCEECRRTPSRCSETKKNFCRVLDNTPVTEPPVELPDPGGPCCPSCYCFFLNGVRYMVPLGDLEQGNPYFDERSATPWGTFRVPQSEQPSPGAPPR